MGESMLSLRMSSNLLQQRSEYVQALENMYIRDMEALYRNIVPYLPPKVSSMLDVGCGLGGINIFTAKRYPRAQLILLDKDGDSGSKIGWHTSVDKFGCYNHLEDTVEFLRNHGVKNDILPVSTIPEGYEVDLCYSFLSWGFHYPLNTYKVKAKTLVADVRRKSGEKIPGDARVIHKGKKHDRLLFTNFLCS